MFFLKNNIKESKKLRTRPIRKRKKNKLMVHLHRVLFLIS